MKMTLLQMVQNILSALNSDEVNTINDTVESAQIAELIRETYFEQFNNITLPNNKTLLRIDGISDVAAPNYMKFNNDVMNIDWIRYRNYQANDKMETVCYLTPEEFLSIVLDYTASTDNVFLTTDPVSGITYYVKSNKRPSYYTSFDNNYIAFDSFDLANETTLHSNNCIAFGTKVQEFLIEDTFIPNLPDNLFPLLLAESKATAFVNQKQISSAKEEQRARRQRIRMQNDQFKSQDQQRRHLTDAPNYARIR